jgi:hypothetical protein
MDNKTIVAAQINAALRFIGQKLELSESESMEIADLYPQWTPERSYAVGVIVKYGVNADGETQLYKVVQAHTSQADWTPNTAASLFSKIGFTESGTPLWTQPQGGHDAYQIGDEVSYGGKIYRCTVANNVWQPDVYGWSEV